MKRSIVKDIILIFVIFIAILAAPFVSDLISEARDSPAAPAQPAVEQATAPVEAAPVTPQVAEKAAVVTRLPVTDAEQAVCPAEWSVGPGRNGRQDRVTVAQDKILLETPYQNMTSVTPMTFDGGGGVDTLQVPGSGYVNVDGARVISLETFRMQNGRINVVNVLAPGLATMEGAQITLHGDADMDIVYLDGCLKWDDPVPAGKGEFLRYVAHDKQGNTATVDVTKGTEVRSLSPKRISEWLQPQTGVTQGSRNDAGGITIQMSGRDGSGPVRMSSQDLIKSLQESERKTGRRKMRIDELRKRFPREPGDGPSPEPMSVLKDTATKAEAKGKIHIVAWGDNSSGQLGTGKVGYLTNIPVIATKVEDILKPDFKIIQLAATANAFCLLRSDKTVWCWGENYFGPEERPFGPIQIDGLPSVKALTGGTGAQMCATTEDDQAWCWTSGDMPPSRFTADWASAPDLVTLSHSFAKVSASDESGCGITAKGEAWCWGGKRGGGFPEKIKAPQPVKSANTNGWSRGCALLVDGTPWCWDHPSRSESSRAFGQDSKFLELFRGQLYTGLRDDGTIWRSDGTNFDHGIYLSSGKLLGDITRLSGGIGTEGAFQGGFACALDKAGAVWCWSGSGFREIIYPAERDYVSRVRGPDTTKYLDHVTDIVVSSDSVIAVVQDRDYELTQETDPVRIFYALVYSGNFPEAKDHYKSMKVSLRKDDPLAQEALLKAIDHRQADIVKVIAETGIDLQLPGQNETAFWAAAKHDGSYRDLDTLRVLLAYGASTSSPGPQGKSALKYVNQWKDKNQTAELIKGYIENGHKLANVDQEIVKNLQIGDSRSINPNRRQLASWRPPLPKPEAPVVQTQEPVEAPKPQAEPKSQAYVRPCAQNIAAPDMHDYDVIFKGKVKAVEPNGTANFDVAKVYKGDVGATIDVIPAKEGTSALFTPDQEAIVFARRVSRSEPWQPSCTPVFDLSKLGEKLTPEMAIAISDLELFAAKIQAMAVFEKEYRADIAYYVLHPDELHEAKWKTAAETLESMGDYERATKVYAAILAKIAAKGGRRPFRGGGMPEEDLCTGLYAADDSTPEFVQFAGVGEYMLSYGRTLFMTGRYAESLRPLCLVKPGDFYKPAHGNAAYYRLQSLLKLGHKSEVDGKHLDFSKTRLADVDLSSLNVPLSNFSGAHFSKLNFQNAKLGGSSFQNADVIDTNFSGADLTGANFKGAKLYGDFSGATLTNAVYDSKTIWPDGFSPSKAGALLVEEELPPRDKFHNLPPVFDVEVVGVYEGKYPPGVSSSFDNYPTGRIDVKVYKKDKPIVLAVGSHDTADWYFHLEPGVKVVGVIVGGLYQQSVFGIPGDVQVIHEGGFYGTFDRDKHGEEVRTVVLKLTGKEPTHLHDDHSSAVFEIR